MQTSLKLSTRMDGSEALSFWQLLRSCGAFEKFWLDKSQSSPPVCQRGHTALFVVDTARQACWWTSPGLSPELRVTHSDPVEFLIDCGL